MKKGPTKAAYEGLLLTQRGEGIGPRIFYTAMTAKEILTWATVSRTFDEPGAAQRMLSSTQVKRIDAFFDASSDNVIPTAATIAVGTGCEITRVAPLGNRTSSRLKAATLEIDLSRGSIGSIIDGQHRIRALEQYEADPDIPLFVAILLDTDRMERALQFVVINNTAKRVSTDLVKAIFSELDEKAQENFTRRLRAVGITLGKYSEALRVLQTSAESPFQNLVAWDANRQGDRIIKPQALEEGIKVVLNQLEASELNLDDALQVFMALWRGVASSWNISSEWSKSKLASKAGLVSATEFLVDRLNLESENEGFELASLEHVEFFAKNVFSKVPSEFWEMTWSEKGLDTQAGRGLIKDSLAEIRRAVAKRDPFPLDAVKSLDLRPSSSIET